jgi:cobyric acid synthase
MPLTENQLIVPALIAMVNSKNGEISTTDLIEAIRQQFTLDNQDNEILLNRNDEKFTQIVRNLKSHKTLKIRGYAKEIKDGFRILPGGVAFLEDNGFV